MDAYRAVYALVKEAPFAPWIEAFWANRLPPDDPLQALLHPKDLRGEAAAWGPSPHGTVLDAQTVEDAPGFADIVKAVCRLCPRPALIPQRLAIYGETSLVVACVGPALEEIRTALIRATRALIRRFPLADEEFQRAEWWIRRVGNDAPANLQALWGAREQYRAAGAPSLPASRHFRLAFLVRLWKERDRAPAETKPNRQELLLHFLSHGEPSWYARPVGFHTTIASGLKGVRTSDGLPAALWPAVRAKLGEFHLSSLAIMGEDPDAMTTVHFFDWITETYVEEKRPGLRVIDMAEFGASQ